MSVPANLPRTAQRRAPARILAASLVVLGLATASTACSGSSDDNDDNAKDPSTSSSTRALPQPSAELELKVGRLIVESAGLPAEFDRTTARDIARVANAYIQTGVLDPLVDGETGDDFESLFGIGVAARVAPGQPDRVALTEEPSPRATGKAKSLGAKLDLTALADQLGAVKMVSGRVAFRISVPTKEGTLVINRLGDLVFEPVESGWLISGYTMLTTREAGNGTNTSTSSATSATSQTSTSGATP